MTNDTLKRGIESLRVTMNREHNAVWNAGVESILAEMVMDATSRAVARAGVARERLFNELAPQLPPPQEPASIPLHSPANSNPYYVENPLEDDEFEKPRFMNGRA